jgi:microcin C transport system ATP-binding protein
MSEEAQQTAAGPLLELDHLRVTFGDTVAVKDVTLAIQRGERS